MESRIAACGRQRRSKASFADEGRPISVPAWVRGRRFKSFRPTIINDLRAARAGVSNTMNNNGWQCARRDAGLPLVRVHDLRHSFARGLRVAGVSDRGSRSTLGHANHSMAGHYTSADAPAWTRRIVEPTDRFYRTECDLMPHRITRTGKHCMAIMRAPFVSS